MFKNKKNDPKYLSPKPTGITVWLTGSIGTISTGKKNLYREEESTEYERRILAVNTPANSSSPHVDGSGCSREGVVVGLKDPHACLRHRALESPRTRNCKPRLKKKKKPRTSSEKTRHQARTARGKRISAFQTPSRQGRARTQSPTTTNYAFKGA